MLSDPKNDGRDLDLSVVVPFYNEEENISELHLRLRKVLDQLGESYEIILVNDGSTDGSAKILDKIRQEHSATKIIHLARNYGQTSALAAGFDHAQGNVVVSMDGDLQHVPEEIPKFLAKLREGYDMVSGWRTVRSDHVILRQFTSKVANRLMWWLSGVRIHDFGTTFRAYRRDLLSRLELSGELHRFVPALASEFGALITEIPIEDPGRQRGQSKYGLRRVYRVMLDMLMVKFIITYSTRPLRIFGSVGLLLMLGGVLIDTFLMAFWVAGRIPQIIDHEALILLSIIFIMIGSVFIAIGINAEVGARIYNRVAGKKIYTVRRLEGFEGVDVGK